MCLSAPSKRAEILYNQLQILYFIDFTLVSSWALRFSFLYDWIIIIHKSPKLCLQNSCNETGCLIFSLSYRCIEPQTTNLNWIFNILVCFIMEFKTLFILTSRLYIFQSSHHRDEEQVTMNEDGKHVWSMRSYWEMKIKWWEKITGKKTLTLVFACFSFP